MRLAIITGGTRGIGRGISEVLASSNEYQGLILTYNTNQEAAEAYRQSLLDEININKKSEDGNENETCLKKVEVVGGDLTTIEARNKIFECVDEEFSDFDLATVVHNAGQYVGITSDNIDGIAPGTKKFGDGSLLKKEEDGSTVLDTTFMDYYQKLYGTAFIDICERSVARMKKAYEKAKEKGEKYRGSIVGISSPGCNANFKVTAGYDMPGSGKCIMEYSIRLFALETAKYGINCNVIIPGVTNSDAWGKLAAMRGMTKEAFFNKFMSMGKVPMNEVIDATDIGDTVKFLAGSGGGRFMTGLSLRVDAGLHLS